jgi:hypothetical protein
VAESFSNWQKEMDSQKILKTISKNWLVVCKGIFIKLLVDLFSRSIAGQKEWSDISKVLEE